MDFEEACDALRMSPETKELAALVAEIFVDSDVAEPHAPVLSLHLLDFIAKEIGGALELKPDTVSKITQRETKRLGVEGKGTLALLVASHPKMLRLYASRRTKGDASRDP